MGISASLFYSTNADAATLYKRVSPSDEQFSVQQTYWNHLKDYLVDQLESETGLSFSSWLQGSYKFGTQVRPHCLGEEFDIDLGVYAEWEGQAEDGDLDPIDLKNLVQELLQKYADDSDNQATHTSDPKPRCNRIHFNNDFHIDTPCYHLNPSNDARRLATEDNTWEASDPKAIYVWWKEQVSEEIRPRARRVVQYLKMWAALKFDGGSKPSSILLTVLVADAITTIDPDAVSGDDEWFSEVVKLICERIKKGHVVKNPVDANENLNRLSKTDSQNFEDGLVELVDVCDRALQCSSKLEAADVWTEAFHHFFPMPDEATIVQESAGALIVLTFDPQISVTATSRDNANIRITGTNSIQPIPKNCDIVFRLANAAMLPPASEVSWVVRNEGTEAEDVSDLGHLSGTGLSTLEHTEYRGTHFMDVSIRQFGNLIGRRRVSITVTGTAAPKRNKPRPAYAKFRGRR